MQYGNALSKVIKSDHKGEVDRYVYQIGTPGIQRIEQNGESNESVIQSGTISYVFAFISVSSHFIINRFISTSCSLHVR